MSKFKNSKESVSSNLYLWYDRPTQIAIRDTYNMKVWPITNIYNEGPINFKIPEQSKGMLQDIHIVTKTKLQKNGQDLDAPQKNVSIINNYGNSLWGQVDVQFDDRVDITQSMRNAYAYKTFFNHVLNSNANRKDYLFYNEAFKMDQGRTKKIEEEERMFWHWKTELDEKIKGMMIEGTADKNAVLEKVKKLIWEFDYRITNQSLIGIANELGYHQDGLQTKMEEVRAILDIAWLPTTTNLAASQRSSLINSGKSLTVTSKLQSPIFNTSKCLPHNMKIRISLNKNTDEFLLLTEEDGYSIFIEECYLSVTFITPQDAFLKEIDNRLKIEPAPYFISKPEIIIKPITTTGNIIRISDVFHDTLPSHAFFCLQKSKDFEGSIRTNPFTFVPFKKFSFSVNGASYFKDPLEVSTINNLGLGLAGDYEYKGWGEYFRQLYKTVGVDLKGDCLINSENFHLNFMVALSLGADQCNITEPHLNLQEKASTSLEIDMGINVVLDDMILIIYAIFDRQIQINGERLVEIIE